MNKLFGNNKYTVGNAVSICPIFMSSLSSVIIVLHNPNGIYQSFMNKYLLWIIVKKHRYISWIKPNIINGGIKIPMFAFYTTDTI